MLNLLLVTTAALFLTAQADDLKEFKLEDGRIKVLLPSAPAESFPKFLGTGSMKMFTAKGPSAVFVVGVSDVPESAKETPEQINARLDAGRDQGLQNSKGKLLKESPIKLAEKYAGRELSIELPGGKEQMRSRYYLVDGRMYLILAVGTPEFIGSDTCAKFLNSLTVGK
jgi:hypothetical protein